MPKRKGDSLTGGTGDVNPQFFRFFCTQPVSDNNAIQPFPLPVQRLEKKDGQAMVMEVLKVQWDLPTLFSGAGSTTFLSGYLTTKDPQLPAATALTPAQEANFRNQGIVIDYKNRQILTSVTGTPSTMVIEEPPWNDLTDGDGHGILVATDNIFVICISQLSTTTPTSVPNTVTGKIMYRWKNVSVQEYIGIVQSQQ